MSITELSAFTLKNHVSLAPGTFCEVRQEKEVPLHFWTSEEIDEVDFLLGEGEVPYAYLLQ